MSVLYRVSTDQGIGLDYRPSLANLDAIGWPPPSTRFREKKFDRLPPPVFVELVEPVVMAGARDDGQPLGLG